MKHPSIRSLLLLLAGGASMPLLAQEKPAPAFQRAERPYGAKIGLAAMTPRAALGVQGDMILLNDIGVEVSATVWGGGVRARYYILSGGMSPYLGVGTGMALRNDGNWLGSWKEWHIGLEHAFRGGLVLQAQLVHFFDRRGDAQERYTFMPGIGYRF